MNQEYLNIYQKYKDELGISFFEFVLLVLIYENQHDILKICYNQNYLLFHKMVASLEVAVLVKWHGTDVTQFTLRKRGEDLFAKLKPKKPKEDVQSWIDPWREIFPEGVNSGGYRYRGSRLEVLKKMIKFVSLYPYTKEEIFEATKRYVDRFAMRGYNFMQQAHYFIDKKDSGSTLAAECESLKESKPQENKANYGGKIV